MIGQYRNSHSQASRTVLSHTARIAAVARQRRDDEQPVSRDAARRMTAARLAAGLHR